jgi:hypothetical protein
MRKRRRLRSAPFCCIILLMSDPKLNLEVQTCIVVTMPGTDFKVAFRKSPDSPQLSTELLMDDKAAASSRHEFLAAAWQAANAKARELGWIV